MNTVIVAGIARSGLSLTMQLLHAGGYRCEGEWPDFEPYPVGRVPWKRCAGSAVKLVDAQLQLPPPGKYLVVRLSRDTTQQAKSFNKFLKYMGLGLPDIPMPTVIESFEKDYATIDKWAAKQIAVLNLSFESLIKDSRNAATMLRDFVGVDLDIDKMVAAVVKRETDCYPVMLETKLLQSV
jgi:hypothetical protein